MKTIPARQAVKNFRAVGDAAQWSYPGEQAAELGYEQARKEMAASRVFREFTPKIHPKFTLGESPAVFTSGSCFAREIEVALHNLGVSVKSWAPERSIGGGMFNRYNTFSTINDFRFAKEGNYDEALMWETPSGWIDYSGNSVRATKDELRDERAAVIDVHGQIAEADVFVLTLGLVEAWYDLKTETYLNFTPSEVLAGNLSRFECRVTDYSENLAAVQNLIAYLRSSFRSDLKVIITVSPVPLNTTFSGWDITQANTLSKATLRTVAQTVADADDLVDYFPSYEMVTLTDPQAAWYPDYRHVRREMVERIMRTFIANYLK